MITNAPQTKKIPGCHDKARHTKKLSHSRRPIYKTRMLRRLYSTALRDGLVILIDIAALVTAGNWILHHAYSSVLNDWATLNSIFTSF